MEKLVSSWSNGQAQSVPENYVLPIHERPGEIQFSTKSVPMIDLAMNDRKSLVQQIMDAGQEYGGFQVINHGVPRKLMDEMRDVLKGFFELSSEEKLKYVEGDYNKCKLLTSRIGYDHENVHFWRDLLKHTCSDPLEESKQHWPDKPANYRDVTEKFVKKLKELSSNLLELICEGLGLEPGYFEKNNQLTQQKNFATNYYPPCPDPSVTLGLPRHADPTVLTLLMQGDVPGLQVWTKDGQWLTVEPIPDALMISVGYFLEIVSNGKLKINQHRAVTNATKLRISGALFISPSNDCIVEPAKALVNAENPPLFKPVQCLEYLLQKNKGMKA